MEILFEYIKPMIFFLILESVIFNLISDAAFKKLTKLFCGMVLIILILIPIGKFLGITEIPENLLKNAQLEQSVRQCEDMINYGDKYLAEKYAMEYRQIIREDIGQMTENEGMAVADCEIDIDTEDGVRIKKIVLDIARENGEAAIDVHTDISISVDGQSPQKNFEEPEIIKIKNQIISHYQVDEEDILIRRVK